MKVRGRCEGREPTSRKPVVAVAPVGHEIGQQRRKRLVESLVLVERQNPLASRVREGQEPGANRRADVLETEDDIGPRAGDLQGVVVRRGVDPDDAMRYFA
jgi:hypothetical protein